MKKKRSSKIGLEPGSVVPVVEDKTFFPKISLIHYTQNSFEEIEVKSLLEIESYQKKEGILWINVDGIHDPKLIEDIGQVFSIHPLAQEDICNIHQRAKIDVFENNMYLVLKMIYPNIHQRLSHEQLSLILGPHYVLSFQENLKGDPFNSVRLRLKENHGPIRKQSADYLAYCLLDATVDHYFLGIDILDEQITAIDHTLLTKPSLEALHKIHHIKRELILFRKSVAPLRDSLALLLHEPPPMIKAGTVLHLRDTFDHTLRVMDSIDTFRDLLSGLMDLYFSTQGNRTNDIMKVLTIITTLFIPPTFIAGVYGMNFEYMPELEWKWGYATALAIMIGFVLGMIVFFKKKKWI